MEAFDTGALHLQHLQPHLQQVEKALATGLPAYAALNHLQASLKTHSFTFVPQSELPKGQAYESFIFQTQRIPRARICTMYSAA